MPRLEFKGRSFVWNHHLGVPYHELISVPEKSVLPPSRVGRVSEPAGTEPTPPLVPPLQAEGECKPSLHDNLIIHGDNLIALKALLPTFAGKVKCIYIDPPYNTGNEGWKYNDNVNSPYIKDWLGKLVDKDDLTRHDKWLCMMTPRLKLLRELLSEDGVIFVSIDDNEVNHLRTLMDEVLGEVNFVATFVWRRRASSGLAEKMVSVDHEYVVCYQKGSFYGFLGGLKDFKSYKNPDNDPKGPWTLGDLTVGMTKDQRPNQYYELIDPATARLFIPNPNRVWSFIRETMNQYISEGHIFFPDNDTKRPMLKRYKKDLKLSYNPISTWMTSKFETNNDNEINTLVTGLNAQGAREIQDVFSSNAFSYPKPNSLPRVLIAATTSENDIILDSFAGSGTTAHAVLALNKEDGGNRKFILVECEDYADTITAERVRRVIKGVPSAKDPNLKAGLGGSFSYYEVGKALDDNRLLSGDELPSFERLAAYIFHTATGNIFDETQISQETGYIGSSSVFDIYIKYKPDLTYLRSNEAALTLDYARSLPVTGRRRVVFAPQRFLDPEVAQELNIDVEFHHLPYEIHHRLS